MADERELCLQKLGAASRAFRVGMEARANEEFVGFIDLMLPLLGRESHAQAALELAPILPEVVAAQQRGDFLRVADLLEYEIAPRL